MHSAVNLLSTIVSLALAVEPAAPDERLAVTAPSVLASAAEAPQQQPDEAPQEAVEEFRRGRILFEAADYRAAKDAFERANSLHPSPDLQYNIAQCHMRLGQYDEAIPAFEAYLEGKADAPDAADVRVQIAEARQRVAEREAALQTLRDARAAREQARPAAVTDGTPDDLADGPAASPERPMIIAGAAVFGLGLAATAGSVTALALAIDRNNDRLAAINAGNPRGESYATAQRLDRQNERLQTAEYVAIGVGSGLTLSGLVVMSVGLARRAKRRRMETALVPTVTPGGYGLSVSGAF